MADWTPADVRGLASDIGKWILLIIVAWWSHGASVDAEASKESAVKAALTTAETHKAVQDVRDEQAAAHAAWNFQLPKK